MIPTTYHSAEVVVKNDEIKKRLYLKTMLIPEVTSVIMRLIDDISISTQYAMGRWYPYEATRSVLAYGLYANLIVEYTKMGEVRVRSKCKYPRKSTYMNLPSYCDPCGFAHKF